MQPALELVNPDNIYFVAKEKYQNELFLILIEIIIESLVVLRNNRSIVHFAQFLPIVKFCKTIV